MKYRALRIVATVYRILGWIVIVLGALSTCAFSALTMTGTAFMGSYGMMAPRATEQFAGGVIAGLFTLVMGLIWTALSGLTLLAFAEGIQVFLDIEENTREMVRRLKEIPGPAAPSKPTPE